ncbi:MAG TPA: PDR/VanB family oxidoreductase [Dokdonella sp.]
MRQIRAESAGVNSYELVAADGGELPAFTAGAHVDVHLPGGLVRQYSLCNDPAERHRYVIAVLREASGRGGSRTLHEHVRVRDTLAVGPPRNHFALAEDAARVILLAGGIGVTPLKAMAHRLDMLAVDYELHYCARDAGAAAFVDALAPLRERGRVRFHFDGGRPEHGLDIAALLREPAPGAHVYYCGPAGFMAACAAASAHWPDGSVHCEHFAAPEPAPADLAAARAPGAFAVTIASTGATIEVGAEQSLVDALQRAGVAIETSCESGLCGTCRVRYLAGEVDHRDCVLGADEQAEYLTACVSRARTPTLVLDL